MNEYISVNATALRVSTLALVNMGVKPCEIAFFVKNYGNCSEEEKEELLKELHLELEG